MATKRKRNDLTLEEKFQIITDFEKDKSLKVRRYAERSGIPKSTISDILKKREEIRKLYEENRDFAACRINGHLTEDGLKLDRLVWEWFSMARSKNVPISGSMIQHQAGDFAKLLKMDKFVGSPGWLQKWQKRHNVSAKTISGESADVNVGTVNDFRQRIPALISGYHPKDIFNADETGLFFRALPHRSLVAKGDQCKGGKEAKERISILFCVSQLGEKVKPFVIGKAENPRCFRGVRKSDLPVYWRSNKKAWMTTALFEDFLADFNRKMRAQNRHVLLFVDNATSHPSDFALSNVTVKFFPPNTTSHLQPLDQGVIRAFKAIYRKKLLEKIIQKIGRIEHATELTKSITVLDAVLWAAQAWKEVKVGGISHCFEKAGFPKSPGSADDLIVEDDDFDDQSMLDVLQEYTDQLPATYRMEIDDYITFDDGLAMMQSSANTIEDIAQEVWRANIDDGDVEVDDEMEDDLEIVGTVEAPITQQQVLSSLEVIKKFCSQGETGLYEPVFGLESSFNAYFSKMKLDNSRQSSMHDFC